MELVVIQTFQTRIEAELFKNYLSSHGIDALVTADDLGGMRPFPLSPSNTKVKVKIQKQDFKKAKLILAEYTVNNT